MTLQKNGRGKHSTALVRDVVLESPDGQLVTLSTWEGDFPAARSIRLTESLKSSVAAAIKPGMEVLSHTKAASNTFTVVFNPRVAEGLKNKSMKLMQGEKGVYLTAMETVVSKNGKTFQQIAGNGQIVANNVQRIAHFSMAALQVASVVTAQAYLAEIDRKLTVIQEGVDATRKWLEIKEWSRLQANYAYLQSIAGTIRGGGLSDSVVTVYLNQIEQIERDSLEIGMTYMSELERIQEMLPEIKQSWHSSGAVSDMQTLDQAMERWKRFANGYMAVQQLRMVAVHLRGLLVSDIQIGNSRLTASQAAMTRLADLWTDFSKAFNGTVSKVDSRFFKGLSAVQRRESRKRTEVFEAEIREKLADVRNYYTSIGEALQEKRSEDEAGMALLVSTDSDGSIIDLRRIVVQQGEATPQ